VSEKLDTAPKRRRRGIKRRTQILEATLRLLAGEGASVITHRAVAEEAGVPIAATTYYFASKEELIAEAFRLHAEKEARRVVAATRTIEKETTKYQLADQLADFLSHGLSDARASLIAEYELLLQAARRPELEAYSRIFYDTIEGQLERTLEHIGSPDPETDTRIIMATLAGLEVDNLSTPNTALDFERLRQLMHRLLEALIARPTDS
jgi:TetR/AcrR family transcriptional regulator, regulator of biofilm formation and stress response